MSVVKDHRFPTSVRWLGGRLTRVSAPEKPDLDVAVPPEFLGGIEGVWSPEELLVAATASCYTVTLAAVAEHLEVPLYDLEVGGVGHVTRRDDGKIAFVAIEISAKILTAEGMVGPADTAARKAKEICVVSLALDVPIHVGAVVSTAAEAPVKAVA